jgi:hypothetical protein
VGTLIDELSLTFRRAGIELVDEGVVLSKVRAWGKKADEAEKPPAPAPDGGLGIRIL